MKCTVSLMKQSKDTIATCGNKLSAQADADAAFAAAKANVAAAMPNLGAKDVPASSKYIAQAMFADDKNAVVVIEQKRADGSYMTSLQFAKASFYNS